MPTSDRRTIKIEVDSGSVKSAIANAANAFWSIPGVQTTAQIAAFGATAYAGARILAPPIRAIGGMLPDRPEYDPYVRAMRGDLYYPTATQRYHGSPEGFTGRNILASEAIYYGHRDQAQRFGASAVGLAAGAIPSLAPFALMHMGVGRAAMQVGGAIGSSLGGGLLGGGVGFLGRVAAAPFGWLGMSGVQNAIIGATGAQGLIGIGGAKVGGIAGGLIGSMLPWSLAGMAASQVSRAMVENVATQRQIEDWVDQTSYRYTYGGASNIARGRGFDYAAQRDIAEHVRKTLTDHTFMRQTDFHEIFRGIQMSDLDFNVRSAEQFKEKFAKVADVLTDIARTFETTLEGAVQMLGAMQQSGFYTTADQAAMLYRNNALARHAGMSSQTMMQIGMTGAETAGQYGISRSFGTVLSTSLASQIARAPSVLDAGQAQRYQEYVQELGGHESVAGMISNVLMQNVSRSGLMRNALYALADTDTMSIDQEMMRRFRSGELSLMDLMDIGSRKATTDQAAFEKFSSEALLYLGEFSGDEAMAFMTQMVSHFQRNLGAKDVRTVLARMGVTNPMLQMIMKDAMFTPGMRSEEMLRLEEAMRLRMNQEALSRTPRGWWEEHIAHPVSQWGHALGGSGLHSWFMEQAERFRNKVFLKIDKVDILDEDFDLENIIQGRRIYLHGESLRDLLPGREDANAYITAVQSSLEEAVAQMMASGAAPGEWEELATFQRDLEGLREGFVKLFDELMSGKITVDEFTRAYVRSLDEIEARANLHGISASGLGFDVVTRLRGLRELTGIDPEYSQSAFDAHQRAQRMRMQARLTSQIQAGVSDSRIQEVLDSTQVGLLRRGVSFEELIREVSTSAYSDSEYAQFLELYGLDQDVIRELGLGVVRLEAGDLDSLIPYLEQISRDEKMARDFTRIMFEGSTRLENIGVQEFLRNYGFENFLPFFERLVELESEGKLALDSAHRGMPGLGLWHLQQGIAQERTGFSAFAMGKPDSLRARRERFIGSILESAGMSGLLGDVGQQVLGEFLLDPILYPLRAGTDREGLLSKDFAHSRQLDVGFLEELLNRYGVTEQSEIDMILDIASGALHRGWGILYDSGVEMDRKTLSEGARENLEASGREWLKTLKQIVPENRLVDKKILEALRRPGTYDILRTALSVFEYEQGDDGTWTRRTNHLAAAEVSRLKEENEDLAELLDILVFASSQGTHVVGKIIGDMSGVERWALETAFSSIGDISRQTLGALTTQLSNVAAGFGGETRQQIERAISKIKSFSEEFEYADISQLYDEDILASLRAGGMYGLLETIEESRLINEALAKVTGDEDFDTTRANILDRMLASGRITEETIEGLGLRGESFSKGEFQEIVSSIYAQALGRDLAGPGSHAFHRDMDQEGLAEVLKVMMGDSTRAVNYSAVATRTLSGTLDVFGKTMRDLESTLNELQLELKKRN